MIRLCLLACIILSTSVLVQQVAGIEPILTSHGNTTILVVLDLHRHHDNSGTCTHPNWENLELAYSMWYSQGNSGSDVGLEIYDGCTSVDRTLTILRERLFQTHSSNVTTTVVGVLSFSSLPEIRVAISAAVHMSEVPLVMVGSQLDVAETENQGKMVTIDMHNNSTVQVLTSLVSMLNWTYITTLSDDKQESLQQHRDFLAAIDENTCVQESYQDVTMSPPNYSNIKTSGVILFSSDAGVIDRVMKNLPVSSAVILVSSGKRPNNFERDVVVLSETFNVMEEFVHFMTKDALENIPPALLSDYYASKYNCSVNETTSKIICPDIDKIWEAVSIANSGRLFHTASSVLEVMSASLPPASTNCSLDDLLSCPTAAMFDDLFMATDSGYGYMTENVVLNTSLILVKEGREQLTQYLHGLDMVQARQRVETFVNTLGGMFPESQCTGWCPTCKQDGCHAEHQRPFDGNYLYIPGDVVIAAMFPLTTNHDLGLCSGYSIYGNTDVLVEAFMYAIQTAKSRYQYLLHNVSLGLIVFDSCSQDSRVTQVMMNFESCLYNFDKPNEPLVPYIVPAYVSYRETSSEMDEQSNIVTKPQISVTGNGKIYNKHSLLFDNAMFNHDAVINILRQLDWKYVGLITSQSARSDINMAAFHDLAMANDICIMYDLDISEGNQNAGESLEAIRRSTIGVFVIFADYNDVDRFFRNFITIPLTKTWIVVETRKNWLDFNTLLLPSGSMLLQRAGRIDSEFDSYRQNINVNQQSTMPSKFWLDGFKSSRDSCIGCELPSPVNDMETKLRASDIIKATDVVLHAVDATYKASCVGVTGPCRDMYTDGFNQVSSNINRVLFNYHGETVDLRAGFEISENYDILNIQASTIVEIGSWINGQLDLEKSRYKAYDSSGDEIKDSRRYNCYGACVCLNIRNSTSPTNIQYFTDDVIDPEKGFTDSSGKFTNALWSIIVVIIAGSGAFATLCLMLYIMCKVCAGAIVRRYLALGLMLLVGMIFLFMSVLPFVFTPSEAVCGTRYFAHGFSYALCYGIILTKLTTLRDYKYIGLGGDISRINQLLSVFFIVAVQVAIGVEWWVLQTPVVYTTSNTTMGQDTVETLYACDFKRGDFLAYHSFVIFLLIVCCLYSISVRNESKNMKEARLLLISSWFCLAIWVALIVTIIVMDRDYIEPICSIGLLANALTMMVVIYFPKLTAISRLRYEVSDQTRRKDSKVDTEFQFERPYSLPGTLHSAVTEKSLSLSYQRSLAAFDSSLSY